MPYDLRAAFTGLVGAVTYPFTGSSPAQTDSSQTHTSNTNADTTIADEPDIEEVDVPTTRVTRKRARAVEAVEVELPNKRRNPRSDAERGFSAGDYEPSRRIEYGKTPMVGSRRVTSRSGGFKPMNTLDSQVHKGNGLFSRASALGKAYVKLPASSLETASSRGINVPPVREKTGDGFQQTPFKKQRLANGESKTTGTRDLVDLTEDSSQDVFNGTPVASNGRSLPSERRKQNSLNLPPTFGDEWVNVSSMTTTYFSTGSPRQKNKDSRTSSRASNRGLDDNLKQYRNATQRSVPSTSTASRRPSQDGDDVQFTFSRQIQLPTDSASGINGINGNHETTTHLLEPRHEAAGIVLKSDEQRLNGVAQNEQPQHRTVRRTIPQAEEQDGDFHSYVQPPFRTATKSPQLRNTFVRDDEGPQKPKPKLRMARDRMKTTSDTISTRVSPIDSSLDELDGAVTVGSRASGCDSPQKTSASIANGNDMTLPEAIRGKQSPSDLPRTKFVASQRPETRHASHTKDQRPSQHDDEDEDRISIATLVCRSCVKSQAGLELVWNNSDRCFYVECDREPQKVPGKNQLVSIGRFEAQNWIQAKRQDFLQVQIKGSRNINSNGSMILHFKTHEGLSTCFALLQYASDDQLTTSSVDDDKMKKIVKNQVTEIQEDAGKQKHSNAVSHAEFEHAAMQKRKAGRKGRDHDLSERIKYEEDAADGRSTVNSRLLHGGLPESNIRSTRHKYGDSSSELSPYFQSQPRRSSRQPKPVLPKMPSPPPPERWTRIHQPQPWAHSVIYPPNGLRRVTVDFKDLERLDEGEFLNDNVISFALRRIEENMVPEHKESVHFFNSFFYTALTSKTGRKAFNYDAVKRWTKNKDLFNFPYVVVPINIDLHWFVAIICNLPNLSRKAAGLDDDEDGERENAAENGEPQENQGDAGGACSAVGAEASTKEVPTDSMDQLSLMDEDKGSEIIQFDEYGIVKAAPIVINEKKGLAASATRPSPVSSKKTKKRGSTAPRSYDPDIPAIITLDSFGSPHATELRNLKDYLSAEAEAKRSMAIDTKQLQGMTAKGIPEQTNFCDCGVYVVGYIEQFAKDPRGFVTKVLTKQLDKQSDFASFDPSAKRDEIREELLNLHEIQEGEHQAKKSGKRLATKLVDEASAASKSAEPTSTLAVGERKASLSPVKTHRLLDGKLSEPALVPALEQALEHNNVIINSMRKPSNEDEDDDMEVGVPRPLRSSPSTGQPPCVTDSRSPIQPQGLGVMDDEDEMLDRADQADANYGAADSNDMPTSPRDELLDPLQEILAHGPNGYRTALEPGKPADEQSPTEGTRRQEGQAQQEDEDHKIGHSEVIDLANETDGIIEVPDSQEQRNALQPTATQRRHIKYVD